jgi:hypothetical protein
MVTIGLVQRLTWIGNAVCVQVGDSPQQVELFTIGLSDSDSVSVRAFKSAMIALLAKAQAGGLTVQVAHADTSAIVDSVAVENVDISPVGPAIVGDFYSVAGANIPAGAQLVFVSGAVTVTVTPEILRPQFVFVSALPAAVPIGRCMLHLEAPGWTTASVPVDVVSGQPLTSRVLYSGFSETSPYNIVFVANPAFLNADGSTVADPVLTNRAGFQDTIRYCLECLLTIDEDALRVNNMDARIRLVAIFDPTQGTSAANTLAQGDSPNICEPRRNLVSAFAGTYLETPDILYVIVGGTTYDRASAWFTTDNTASGSTTFTYDGTTHTTYQTASTPGTIALPTDADQTGPTPLHEFGHAASDFNDGRVIDLYVDGVPSGTLVINKKARAQSTDAIPTNFATYQAVTYKSDQNRDGLGYPSNWTSYQPELADATRPNLMDNYWLTPDHKKCRLDKLTHQWFIDRLTTKINR